MEYKVAYLDNNNNIIKLADFLNREDAINSEGIKVFVSDISGNAIIGYFYNEELNAFVQPKPYPSYVLDEENFWWNPPVPYPNDGKEWYWNEETLSWVE